MDNPGKIMVAQLTPKPPTQREYLAEAQRLVRKALEDRNEARALADSRRYILISVYESGWFFLLPRWLKVSIKRHVS